MGKNYKEVFSYRYLHNIGKVPKKFLIKLFKKWSRHNFDIDEMRANRKKKKQEIFDKAWKNELKNREYD